MVSGEQEGGLPSGYNRSSCLASRLRSGDDEHDDDDDDAVEGRPADGASYGLSFFSHSCHRKCYRPAAECPFGPASAFAHSSQSGGTRMRR